ncbi:nitroreductase family deazaflavin-dependent oxidoreductase [Nocardioides dubius]|uniref:Nitroreductase family deazaflavin-dependent oxidoreductase n=1 Tax=Nocardioides dubius TaxID=317019 RepID=A0ABP4EEW9_9ACTN
MGEYVPSTQKWVRDQVELYERTGGEKGNTINGMPIVVITSVGHKSGNLRKNPVMRVEKDGVYAAVASKGGAPEHPDWFHNFLADPQVQLQDGPEPHRYTARLATPAERQEWWPRAVEAFPPYAEYATKTDREIPVFLLERS